jgi:hypothetical protein
MLLIALAALCVEALTVGPTVAVTAEVATAESISPALATVVLAVPQNAISYSS